MIKIFVLLHLYEMSTRYCRTSKTFFSDVHHKSRMLISRNIVSNMSYLDIITYLKTIFEYGTSMKIL